MSRERIEAAFARARAGGRAAFIPFITAGDPDPAVTREAIRILDRSGADLIELGVPFSDPVADGPVIQRASQRGLASGMTLSGAIDLAGEAREEIEAAIVLFTYANPVQKMGEAEFARRCGAAGIDGVLITDMPVEESGSLRNHLRGHGPAMILLVAPTSGAERIRRIAGEAEGFIYYIARTGVTGSGSGMDPALPEDLRALRKAADLPVAVGFGIATAEQYAAAASIADGVVVGSAIVAAMEDRGGDPEAVGTAVRKIVHGESR